MCKHTTYNVNIREKYARRSKTVSISITKNVHMTVEYTKPHTVISSNLNENSIKKRANYFFLSIHKGKG